MLSTATRIGWGIDACSRFIPTRRAFLLLPALLGLTSVAMAQDPILFDGPEPASIHGARRLPSRPVPVAGPALPTWRYQLSSPVNGISYSGYMVGTDPFRRGPRTVTIPVIVQFTNSTTGLTTTFDPSTVPDAACTAGLSAMSLVENSPVFQNQPWTLNGVNVGTTQYIDAFQRSISGTMKRKGAITTRC